VGTKLVAYLKAFANYNTTVISTCVPTNIVTDPKFAASVAEMLAVSSQYRFLANLPDELKEWLEAQEETKKAAEQHASVRAINAARES
jgi:Arc/MetJ family transcription regulator